MIDLFSGGIAEMWQGVVPAEVKAISYAIERTLRTVLECADKTVIYADMAKTDENIVDLLAAENRAMYYDQSLPRPTKESIVKASISGWYAKAGTPAAVKELVQAVFGEGEIIEWFDYTEGDKVPYTFDIKTNGTMGDDILASFAKIIKRVKNERSHLRRVLVDKNVKVLGHSAAIAFSSPIFNFDNNS